VGGYDVDDFKSVGVIAEEDNVSLVWEASHVGAQFRAGAAECPGKGGEADAVVSWCVRKAAARLDALSLTGNVAVISNKS
jgi:hypothetical protein